MIFNYSAAQGPIYNFSFFFHPLSQGNMHTHFPRLQGLALPTSFFFSLSVFICIFMQSKWWKTFAKSALEIPLITGLHEVNQHTHLHCGPQGAQLNLNLSVLWGFTRDYTHKSVCQDFNESFYQAYISRSVQMFKQPWFRLRFLHFLTIQSSLTNIFNLWLTIAVDAPKLHDWSINYPPLKMLYFLNMRWKTTGISEPSGGMSEFADGIMLRLWRRSWSWCSTCLFLFLWKQH